MMGLLLRLKQAFATAVGKRSGYLKNGVLSLWTNLCSKKIFKYISLQQTRQFSKRLSLTIDNFIAEQVGVFLEEKNE